MNKRKRVAALKHRRKRIKYENKRRMAILAGALPEETRRRPVARPRLVRAPFQEVGVAADAAAPVTPAAPVKRTRRAVAKVEPTVAEAPAAPVKRTRRAVAKVEPTVAEAPTASVKRTRRAAANVEPAVEASAKPTRKRKSTSTEEKTVAAKKSPSVGGNSKAKASN